MTDNSNLVQGPELVDRTFGDDEPTHAPTVSLNIVTYAEEVTGNKQLRKDIDDIVQRVKDLPSSRERSLAITNLQQGIMWLGMDLKRLGEANPYPSSKDASTGTKIEPTADGLKF